MRHLVTPLVLIVLLCGGGRLDAQFKEGFKKPGGGTTAELTTRYQVGVIIKATRGTVTGIRSTVPLPGEWPEQTVREVEEEITANVRRLKDRQVAGVRQLVIEVRRLRAGEVARALVIYEIKRRPIAPPTETDDLTIPKKLDRKLRRYLLPSPYIESTNSRIRRVAKKIIAGKEKEPDWNQVEAIYDYVRENVTYQNGKLKGALKALQDGTGDCEEMTSLFIALCRASKIAARTVWVPGHCYPEFYLTDADGKGKWYPCQAAGTREFGGISEHRPILQKGDSFKDPDRPRKRMRYMSEFLRARNGQPTVSFVRKQLAAD